MRTIKIDNFTKMQIEYNNYVLLYKIKAGARLDGKKAKSEFKWEVAGYFPTLETLLDDYVVNAPARSKKSIKSLRDVVKCIKSAEKKITKLIKE